MVTICAVLVLAFAADPADGPPVPEPASCSVEELRRNPDGYHWPLTRIEQLVDEAPVIVRAVATGVAADPAPGSSLYPIRFSILEILRGSVAEDELILVGRLVDEDDFNPGDAPYQIVRPSGQRGDCFTDEYRIGAEYFLLLEERSGKLTPHWNRYPLAPTNEQVRGGSDPWVLWVKSRVGEESVGS
jgi:hypothetical protein